MAAKQLICRTALAAATLAGAALVPALAHAEPASPATRSSLDLMIRGAGRGEGVRSAVLTCQPAGGSHPYASDACRALREVNGDFNQLSGGHSMCTLEYSPVTLIAKGSWRGTPVTFEKTYSNACSATAATGKVFSF